MGPPSPNRSTPDARRQGIGFARQPIEASERKRRRGRQRRPPQLAPQVAHRPRVLVQLGDLVEAIEASFEAWVVDVESQWKRLAGHLRRETEDREVIVRRIDPDSLVEGGPA